MAGLRSASLAADDSMRTPIVAAPRVSAPDPTDTDSFHRGLTVGRYMVVDQLGKGGLGAVYSAYDPELDRKVAVKVLRTGAAREDPENVMQIRLLREARAMAKLSHPNVVPVFDVGTYAGQVFVAMELIEGLTLRDWRKKFGTSWEEIRDVMVSAGDGVAAAHAAGLIHRDFKPANVLVGDDGRVRVLDFGLARGVQDNEPLDADLSDLSVSSDGDIHTSSDDPTGLLTDPLTISGQCMGTPGYMAPEQYDPNYVIDERADQFAFCVSFYETMYAQRPFPGKDLKTRRAATLSGEVAPPRRDLKAPQWLKDAIFRGMSTDPADRFASFQAMLDAMTVDRRARRRQWGLIGGLIALTALVTGAITFAAAAEVPTEAQDAVEQLTIDARARAAQSFFVYPPTEDPEADTAYTVVERLEALAGPAEQLADERGDELRDEFATTLNRLGDRYWEQEGGRPFAVDYYASALVFRSEDQHARDRVLLTPGELATLRQNASDRTFSTRELQAAASLVALAEEDEAQRLEKLAKVYESGPGPGLATSNRLEALLGDEKAEKVLKPRRKRSKTKTEATPTKATVPQVRGPQPESEPEVPPEPEPEAASGGQKSGSPGSSAPPRDPKRAKKLAAQAQSAFKAGNLSAAEKLFHQALERDRNSRAAVAGLAELNFERGRYRDAVRFGKRAVELAPKKAQYRILLGDAHFKVLDYASARRHYEKAKKLGHSGAAKRLQRLEETVGK
jgi:tRNA A-37 threonylcarbamoyl transferase component Bud32/tetratricopeptide (TPR) repeat protein